MTNSTNDVQTFDIFEHGMEALTKKVTSMNKRAAKIGTPPISVVIESEQFVADPYMVARYNRPLTKKELAQMPQVRQFTISIDGTGPKINGYKFIGTLDHKTVPGSVIVNTVPGEVVPEEFFHANTNCDHCDKHRIRTETFVFEDEDGNFKKVGRSCIRDYFGHDAEKMARMCTGIINLVGGIDDEFGGYGGGEAHHWALSVLTNAVTMIRSFGWVPRSKVDFDSGRSATADDVIYYMTPAYGKDAQRAKDIFVSKMQFHKDPEADRNEAIAALAWLEEQDGSKNEYMHNLKVLKNLEYMPVSKFGYWCSVISAYQRAQDRLNMVKVEKKLRVNEYIGEISKRQEFEVECTGIQYIEGAYGSVCIHRMLTTEGHTLVWFGNAGSKMDVGDKYIIAGTVKKHDVYNEYKQTHLTRVKVKEELSTKDVETT